MKYTKVMCEVNTCAHWLPGKLCGAKNIDILYEEEHKMSQIAEQTECKTFNHRKGIANMIGALDNVNWSGFATELVKPGLQITPSVTCIVESCIFWESNLCNADSIDVTGKGAVECQATNCQTFSNKHSNF